MDDELEVTTIRDGWRLSTWAQDQKPDTPPVAPLRRAELAAAIADKPHSHPVQMSAGELRALLAWADRPKVRGARIASEDGSTVYLVTPDQSGLHLGTVEVVAGSGNTAPFRVPVRLLEDLMTYVLRSQERAAAEFGGEPDDVFIVDTATRDGNPSAEELLDLRTGGVSAKGIAAIYNRSEGRIFQLLREAQRQHPQWAWPATTKGPRPKTTDAKRAPGTRKEAN